LVQHLYPIYPITAARPEGLKHSDRIYEVHLIISASLLARLAAWLNSFPELECLCIASLPRRFTILPNTFFGWSHAHLPQITLHQIKEGLLSHTTTAHIVQPRSRPSLPLPRHLHRWGEIPFTRRSYVALSTTTRLRSLSLNLRIRIRHPPRAASTKSHCSPCSNQIRL
jgi:hypothetical protein